MVQWSLECTVQGSSPVVETSAGVPLIAMRLFAAEKWSAWLVSKGPPPVSQAPWQVTLNLIQYLTASLPLSPFREHTTNTRFTDTLCSRYCGKIKKRARIHAHGQVESAIGGQWAATSPWILQYFLLILCSNMGHFPSHPVSQGVYFYHYLKVQFPIHINKSDVLSHCPDYLFTYGLRGVIIICFW